MSEDRLSRRLQRWSQWQAELQRAVPNGSTHWSTRGKKGVRSLFSERPCVCFAKKAPDPFFDLRSGVEAKSALGRYWHLSRSLETVWPGANDYVATSIARFPRDEARATSLDRRQQELARFFESFPSGALFLDLETCGLAGSAIFLAGLIRFDEGELKLQQLWARNHAEERGVIGALRDIIEVCSLVVTFNGKSFDWPQVRDRATLHTGIVDGAIRPLDHYDLLHHARRRYGKQFGNCKLQTLERFLCGRHRQGDIPGDQIPAVYADYVRTGDENLVQPILHHNALDLVTLLQLAITIADENVVA